MSKIGKISIALEVDDKVCFVILPEDRMRLLMDLAAQLSDNGKLQVVKAPDDFRFMEMGK